MNEIMMKNSKQLNKANVTSLNRRKSSAKIGGGFKDSWRGICLRRSKVGGFCNQIKAAPPELGF
jgi:hypothetical protein